MTTNSTEVVGGTVPALVSTEWLAGHLDARDVRICDVRWYLPHVGKQGRDEYGQGHIPGAVFLELDTVLARPAYDGPGRHPIPDARAFELAMRRAGIGPQTHVVAYDDAGGSIAGRLWWLLRYFGHDRASVLDGSIVKWRAEGRPLDTTVPAYPEGTYEAQAPGGGVVDKHTVRRLAAGSEVVVMDARARERYEGQENPVDARFGHVPGARSAPFAGNLTGDAAPVFKAPDELRAQFEALGVTPGKTVVAYCGSGVTACHTLLALHLAGHPDALLYEGSWSDWSRDESLPVATGPDAGA
ncbi:MAG: Thiosulfate sulfurtransferase, rhodanese [uncultured Chloroflexi bacterium]|uniref:Thiosulfate sulfurtransferase, rhodanese n=1 Tax=uncultured Chloroflexota bacterium TaxID=166587 RepID=A0A6J4KIH6_9CHLR|nr:MAG: Thiosulfate sulfurtransferase, rhodanese [uncultured Chloroflexota bacterium]